MLIIFTITDEGMQKGMFVDMKKFWLCILVICVLVVTPIQSSANDSSSESILKTDESLKQVLLGTLPVGTLPDGNIGSSIINNNCIVGMYTKNMQSFLYISNIYGHIFLDYKLGFNAYNSFNMNYENIPNYPDKIVVWVEEEILKAGQKAFIHHCFLIDIVKNIIDKEYKFDEYFDETITNTPPINLINGYQTHNKMLVINCSDNNTLYISGLSLWRLDLKTGKIQHMINDKFEKWCAYWTGPRLPRGGSYPIITVHNKLLFKYYWPDRQSSDNSDSQCETYAIDSTNKIVAFSDLNKIIYQDLENINWNPNVVGVIDDRYIVLDSEIYDFEERKFKEKTKLKYVVSFSNLYGYDQKNKMFYFLDIEGEDIKPPIHIPENVYLYIPYFSDYNTFFFQSFAGNNRGDEIYRLDLETLKLSLVSFDDADTYCGLERGTGPDFYYSIGNKGDRLVLVDNKIYKYSWVPTK